MGVTIKATVRERSQFCDHSVILTLEVTYIVALVRWSTRIARTSRIADDRGAIPKEANIMLLAIGVLTLLVLLFALLAVVPLLPEVASAETALTESQVQPVMSFPADRAQAA